MSRWRFLALCLAFVAAGRAQENYFGFGAANFFAPGAGIVLLPSVQFGGAIGYGLEVRGTLETVVLASTVGVDLLYAFPVAADVRGYVGGGADLLYQVPFEISSADLPNAAFGAHGTVGVRHRNGNAGFYGEVQPYAAFDGRLAALKARVGINIYF